MTDLFCGAGVGACGFKIAGFDIIDAIDNMQYAVDTYNLNIGNHARVGDLKKMNPSEIKDADVIVATPPCKSFSFAGKGLGEKDPKHGDLFEHTLHIIKAKKPKAFIIENVKGLISKKHSHFFDSVIFELKEMGYNVNWKLTNCWEYGVPQVRDRVFIIGIKKDLNKKFEFPSIIKNENERPVIRDAIGDLPEPCNSIRNHQGYGIRKDEEPFVDKIPIGGNWRALSEEEQKIFLGGAYNSGGGRTGFLRKISMDNPAHTITSQMNGKNNAQILDTKDKFKNQGDYCKDDFTSRYTSRNRQRQWDEPSFCIVSQAKQLPLHPEPKLDVRDFKGGKSDQIHNICRRFTVRECLRLQTVPDWFYFPESVQLPKQYERCSGIPSLLAYKLGKQLIQILS